MKDRVYAIAGPTAAGKTKAALELAGSIGAEVISVDSRQVYRYLDVGTDKASIDERKKIPHHMIDVADPDEIFTAADFLVRAQDAIKRISSRGRIPLLVGGTPLYYKALEGNLLSETLPRDESVRRELNRIAESEGAASLYARLCEIDPQCAARIHPNDQVRLVRALEIFSLTGRSATEIYSSGKKMSSPVEIFYFGFNAPRPLLYERIERRVIGQFHGGYPEEVKWLLQNGYSRDLPALRGFGYRELVLHLDGKISFNEALEGDVRSTKAFARRQMTWFKHFSPIIWYDISIISMEMAVSNMRRKILTGNDIS
jgi:tRNA dimethylallyltransferase